MDGMPQAKELTSLRGANGSKQNYFTSSKTTAWGICVWIPRSSEKICFLCFKMKGPIRRLRNLKGFLTPCWGKSRTWGLQWCSPPPSCMPVAVVQTEAEVGELCQHCVQCLVSPGLHECPPWKTRGQENLGIWSTLSKGIPSTCKRKPLWIPVLRQ